MCLELLLYPQEEVIHKLNQELSELQQLQIQQGNHPSLSKDHTHSADVCGPSSDEVVQQLKFGSEAREEGEGERLVQLAIQVEDFNYQQSVLTEQLEDMQRRAESAEVRAHLLLKYFLLPSPLPCIFFGMVAMTKVCASKQRKHIIKHFNSYIGCHQKCICW